MAHMNAERLAALCKENIGQTIGYQIRLESKYVVKILCNKIYLLNRNIKRVLFWCKLTLGLFNIEFIFF